MLWGGIIKNILNENVDGNVMIARSDNKTKVIVIIIIIILIIIIQTM